MSYRVELLEKYETTKLINQNVNILIGFNYQIIGRG